MENGEFLATVAQYPAEMGKLGVDNMLKIFDGGEAVSYTHLAGIIAKVPQCGV